MPSSPQDLQRKHISKQYAMMWTMYAYLISSVPCAGMCAKRWVWRGIQFLVLADQVIVHLYICCFEVVHIWLIRGRTRELDVGPSPKWPNVKTTFAAEKKKAKQNNTWVNFMSVTVTIKNMSIEKLLADCKSFKFSWTTNSVAGSSTYWKDNFRPCVKLKPKLK